MRKKLHKLMAANLSHVLGGGENERIAQAAVSLRGQKGASSWERRAISRIVWSGWSRTLGDDCANERPFSSRPSRNQPGCH